MTFLTPNILRHTHISSCSRCQYFWIVFILIYMILHTHSCFLDRLWVKSRVLHKTQPMICPSTSNTSINIGLETTWFSLPLVTYQVSNEDEKGGATGTTHKVLRTLLKMHLVSQKLRIRSITLAKLDVLFQPQQIKRVCTTKQKLKQSIQKNRNLYDAPRSGTKEETHTEKKTRTLLDSWSASLIQC